MSFQGPSASQGAFILPSYPLPSPRSSPKHGSSPAHSPKKSQDSTMSFSNSWPLKSFEGLPKPGSQKQLLSPKSGDNTGRNVVSIMTTDFRFAFWAAWSSGQKTYSGREVGVVQCPSCNYKPTSWLITLLGDRPFAQLSTPGFMFLLVLFRFAHTWPNNMSLKCICNSK